MQGRVVCHVRAQPCKVSCDAGVDKVLPDGCGGQQICAIAQSPLWAAPGRRVGRLAAKVQLKGETQQQQRLNSPKADGGGDLAAGQGPAMGRSDAVASLGPSQRMAASSAMPSVQINSVCICCSETWQSLFKRAGQPEAIDRSVQVDGKHGPLYINRLPCPSQRPSRSI
jgi:hypothetical protein